VPAALTNPSATTAIGKTILITFVLIILKI
jgi:hypothetical protein